MIFFLFYTTRFLKKTDISYFSLAFPIHLVYSIVYRESEFADSNNMKPAQEGLHYAKRKKERLTLLRRIF